MTTWHFGTRPRLDVRVDGIVFGLVQQLGPQQWTAFIHGREHIDLGLYRNRRNARAALVRYYWMEVEKGVRKRQPSPSGHVVELRHSAAVISSFGATIASRIIHKRGQKMR